MNGHKFEYKCAKILRRKGFHHVKVTPTSGDQGVDIIGYKWFSKYAFQCKYYSYPVGNKAVQEVYAGGKYYDCDRFVVMTNGTYTRAARNAAEKLDVQLWENCSLLKSASPFWILFNVINCLCTLLGFYLLAEVWPFSAKELFYHYKEAGVALAGLFGWLGCGNLLFSCFSAAIYLILAFLMKEPFYLHYGANNVNLLFFIPAVLSIIHIYFLKPRHK